MTEEYTLIYTTEEPNEEFATKLEEVLEASYNVNIVSEETENVQNVIEALVSEKTDMGLVENLVNEGDGIHTVVPIFPKILHLFYKGEKVQDLESLFYDRVVYIGRIGSASYNFMIDFFEYFNLDSSRIEISERANAEVLAIFSVLMTKEQLIELEDFRLYSLEGSGDDRGSLTEGISLRFPRARPFVIPEGIYGDKSKTPIFTVATDMVFVVREGMGVVAVNDLAKSLFLHREQFVHVHPSFYSGIIENFDRSRLSYSLHEGARAYLDRDEPGFFERYAELAGVVFTIMLALGSGIVSLGKRRKQKKKDKVDVFYEHLMKIKNELPTIGSVEIARSKIYEVKEEQDKAFKMLINEEIEANDGFRIYMQLSKETIDDIRIRLKLLKERSARLEQ